jgi:NAD(P)-dependent dehydrogenase (short-subunit alcohol dehydrogenase family)
MSLRKNNKTGRETMSVINLFSLKGKVALVTGGAGMVGSLISTALGEAGATVVIADLVGQEERAEELQKKGFLATAIPLDLSKESSIIALKEQIIAKYGKIGILFNNAVKRIRKPLELISVEEWEELAKVNSTGFFLCCKVFIEQMAKQKSGNIINISSIYGIVGPDFRIYEGTKMTMPPDYAFSKGGVVNFTRYLATVYAKYNIRVNTISLGSFCPSNKQKGIDKDYEKFLKNYISRVPLGRTLNENDVKGASLFLASEASAYITGHNLVVDGGWTVW